MFPVMSLSCFLSCSLPCILSCSLSCSMGSGMRFGSFGSSRGSSSARGSLLVGMLWNDLKNSDSFSFLLYLDGYTCILLDCNSFHFDTLEPSHVQTCIYRRFFPRACICLDSQRNGSRVFFHYQTS